MTDLETFQARKCLTAVGFLIHQEKVLLVHHKKLDIWLAPGGHINEGELPHRAAEREFLEETGLMVEAISCSPEITDTESQYLPIPFVINLHWISKANYDSRVTDRTKETIFGCEQHLVFAYLVKPVSPMLLKLNKAETLGIDWFTKEEVNDLKTTNGIKSEINLAFSMAS